MLLFVLNASLESDEFLLAVACVPQRPFYALHHDQREKTERRWGLSSVVVPLL